MKTTVLYFSPTGGTEKIARRLGEAFAGAPEAADLCGRAFAGWTAAAGELAIFAVPVFAGRVPGPAAAAIRRCKGEGAFAAALAVYGNRAYDDALRELCGLLTAQGFTVAAAGAFVAEHSMLREVAAGRPDAQDLAELDGFAEKLRQKLAGGAAAPVSVPGEGPYCTPKALPPVRPFASSACTRCGLCAARCPVGAIPEDAPDETRKGCILCMRCVTICPQGARELPALARGAIRMKLGKLKGLRRENEILL